MREFRLAVFAGSRIQSALPRKRSSQERIVKQAAAVMQRAPKAIEMPWGLFGWMPGTGGSFMVKVRSAPEICGKYQPKTLSGACAMAGLRRQWAWYGFSFKGNFPI